MTRERVVHVEDRPDWSALSQMAAQLREAGRRATRIQSEVLAVRASAWSPDRLIRATVGPRGHLLELEIDPRIYRQPNSSLLGSTIVATVREATERAMAAAQDVIDDNTPADLRPDHVGPVDVRGLMRTHDADLPEVAGDAELR